MVNAGAFTRIASLCPPLIESLTGPPAREVRTGLEEPAARSNIHVGCRPIVRPQGQCYAGFSFPITNITCGNSERERLKLNKQSRGAAQLAVSNDAQPAPSGGRSGVQDGRSGARRGARAAQTDTKSGAALLMKGIAGG